MNRKKIIIVFVLVSIVIGVATFFFIKNRGKESSGSKTTPLIQTEEYITKDGVKKLTAEKISDQIVFYPKLIGGKIFFFSSQGMAFYSFDPEKKEAQQISPPIGTTPNKTWWSPDGTKVIFALKYDSFLFRQRSSPLLRSGLKDGDQTVWLFDTNKKAFAMLNKNIESLSWSIDSKKIIYHFFNMESGEDNVSTANPDGSSWKKLIDLITYGGAETGFLPEEKFFYFEEPTELAGTKLSMGNLVETKAGEFLVDKNIATDVLDLPEKNMLLYQAFDEKLSYVTTILLDKNSREETNLETIASLDRIAIDGSGFLAISVEDEEEDASTKKITITNLQSKEKTILTYPQESANKNLSFQNLMLADDGKTLYFSSGSYLYKIAL